MGSHPTFVALIYDVSTASRPWRSRNVLQEFKYNPQKKRVLLLDRGEVEPESIFEVRLQEFKYNPQKKRVLLLDRGEVEPENIFEVRLQEFKYNPQKKGSTVAK